MTTFRVSLIVALCAAPALMLPAQAFAGTRAQSSKTYAVSYGPSSSSQGNDDHGNERHGKDNRGPKDGFPHNHGREVAEEHANEHAPFKSNGC